MTARRSKSVWNDRAISILSPLILLALWEICARTHVIDTRFFPAPSNVIKHLFEMAASGELWRHLGASLYRLVVGFIVGCLPAIVIGLAIGLYAPSVRQWIP